MDVRLSAEQQALRDSAAAVVDRLGLRTVRDLDDSDRARRLDNAVADSGWRELRCAFDGSGPLASAVEVAVVAEELGRGLADTAFVGPVLAAELRRRVGAPAAEAQETVALSADLASPVPVAGEGAVAVDAAGSASALVLVPAAGGFSLARVEVEPAKDGVDLTRPAAAVEASLATGLPGGEGPLDERGLQAWTALGLAMTSADLVGVMRGAIDLATGYAASRKQYGVAVGSFQAIQHLLADAFVAMEGSRSVARHAAWAVDALPPPEALAAAATAKAYCARAARSVCEAAIQVHGGIGNTWECLAHVYLRRALLSSDVLGGVGANLARVLEHRGLANYGATATGERSGGGSGLQ